MLGSRRNFNRADMEFMKKLTNVTFIIKNYKFI